MLSASSQYTFPYPRLLAQWWSSCSVLSSQSLVCIIIAQSLITQGLQLQSVASSFSIWRRACCRIVCQWSYCCLEVYETVHSVCRPARFGGTDCFHLYGGCDFCMKVEAVFYSETLSPFCHGLSFYKTVNHIMKVNWSNHFSYIQQCLLTL